MMDKPKLLIADSNEEFLQALAEELRSHYQVYCCRNGADALQILRSQNCATVIMDLLLPQIDGLTLLQTMVQEGIYPAVLVITGFLSDYSMEAMSRLGVGYVMQKPCDVRAAMARAMTLNQRLMQLSTANAKTIVIELLNTLGLSIQHHGYVYLMEAILLMTSDPTQAITKELYPRVGERFHREGRVVERSIRNALDVAWKRRNPDAWKRYFPDGRKRPTNGAFISKMSEVLRMQQMGKTPSREK